MDNNKNYKVIISKSADASGDIAAKLASLFKIPTEKASSILMQNEFIIKKQTNKETAEKFHKAISNAGANCRIEEIVSEVDAALPTIEEIATPTDVQPLTDPVIKDIPSSPHSRHVNLSLAAAPEEKSASDSDKNKAFENIDPENFCPECGTIRAASDSACVHCGYDPQEIKSSRIKSILIKLAVAVIILAIAIFIALPFYQQYAQRMQIENDLKLAFVARNTVTEFIQRTNFWPNQNIDAGLPKQISNQSVKSVVVGSNAVITVTLNAHVLNGEEQTLIFTPNTLKGRIVWNCLKGTLSDEFRPDICRQTDSRH